MSMLNAAPASIPTVFTVLRYRDARRAIQWLREAFGFEPGVIHPPAGPTVDHAVMFYGAGGIMLGSDRDNDYPLGAADQAQGCGMYVIVEDLDAHHLRAKDAGAEIVIALADTDYGSREYTARDLEGHVWTFGTYRPDPPANP